MKEEMWILTPPKCCGHSMRFIFYNRWSSIYFFQCRIPECGKLREGTGKDFNRRKFEEEGEW